MRPSAHIITLSHELDWAMRPAWRVDPATVSGETDWPAMATAIAGAKPTATILSLDAPVDRWFAASAILRAPDGGLSFAYAHPSTGAAEGFGDWVGAQRILRNLHRHLNLPTKI